jgi:RNA polymerase sigma factor, sigma-70 family
MKHEHSSFASARGVAGAYQGDSADRIRRFVPMVRSLAWHVHGSGRAGIELEDLVQAGMVALTECSLRHNLPGEDGFAAYAKMRVRGAMLDLVRRTIPLSRGASERRRQLREHETALRGALGRPPQAAELAEAMGMTEAELAAMMAETEPLRMEPIDEAYSDSDLAFADSAPDAFATLADSEMREALADAIAALPQRLQLVVQLYFVEEMNLSEIAAVLEVSIPRVHQLKAQALGQLKAGLAGIAEVI